MLSFHSVILHCLLSNEVRIGLHEFKVNRSCKSGLYDDISLATLSKITP